MTLPSFFRDQHGRQTVVQPPNVPLGIWAAATIVNLVFFANKQHGLDFLAGAALFTWAYLEITSGTSWFRRTLGAVVMFGLIVTAFWR